MEGDYQVCFDNSFSHFSEKMVFFELYVEGQGGDVGGDEEWAGLEEMDENMLQYKLQDMRVSCSGPLAQYHNLKYFAFS